MTVGRWHFNQWTLQAYAKTEREWFCPETILLNDWPRGKILQTILEIWEGIYGTRLVPKQLELGWTYRQHQRDLASLLPPDPFLEIDGEQFRHVLRWLREAYAPEESLFGPPPDLPITVVIQDGMLRLRTSEHDLGVDIKRGWIDSTELSLRTLLNLPPACVRGWLVKLVQYPQRLVLSGHDLKKWAGEVNCGVLPT